MTALICRPGDPDYVVPGSTEYRKHIGCSMIGDIMGHGYNTPLQVWKKLTNKALPDQHKAIFDRGHDMEPIMTRMVRDKGRLLTAEQVQYRDPERPWLIYHCDGMFPKWSPLDPGDNPHEGAGLAEWKAPGSDMAAKMAREGMSKQYICQGQGGMHVAAAALGQPVQWGTFGYLDYDNYELVAFDVGRSEAFIVEMLQIVDHFWAEHVVKDIPPPDGLPTERVDPPVISGDLEIISDGKVFDLSVQLSDVMEQMEPLTASKKELVAALKVELDAHSKIEVPGVMKYSHSQGKDKTTYDAEGLFCYVQNLVGDRNRLAEIINGAAPDTFHEDILAWTPDHFRTVKPGNRPFKPTRIKEQS